MSAGGVFCTAPPCRRVGSAALILSAAKNPIKPTEQCRRVILRNGEGGEDGN